MIKIYAIKDTVAGTMGQPFYEKNRAMAIRSATASANNNEGIKAIAKDLTLFELGEYDEETGQIVSNVEFVINVIDLIKEL